MSTSPQDKGDVWVGLEPEQPKSSRGAYWVALLATLFLLVGAVALGVFLYNQRADSGDDALVVQPTAPAADQTATAAVPGLVPSTAPETTAAPELAATATLPAADGASAQVTAVRLAAQPIIDAVLDEWADVPAVSSPHIVYRAPSWDGSDDLEVSWQFAWDEFNLYFAATVTDDIHAQNQSGNTIFRGDSLDLQIDTDLAGDYGPALSPDDFQITFSPGDFAGLPASAFRFQGTTDGDMLDAPGAHNILMAAQSRDGGYILEAAVPWRDLNVTPLRGMQIGLALNATDDDQPGVAIQEIMKSNSAERAFGDPTTWGTLTLQ